MRPDLLLCGSRFGLQTKRHRIFEFWKPLACLAPTCRHVWKNGRPIGVYGHTGRKATGNTSGNHGWLVSDWREALGIDWMPRDSLAQAIPPVYSEYVGRQLIEACGYVHREPKETKA